MLKKSIFPCLLLSSILSLPTISIAGEYGDIEGFRISAVRLPHVKAVADPEDTNDFQPSIPFDRDLETGDGYGVVLDFIFPGTEGAAESAIGVFYFNSEHRDKQINQMIDSHSIYLEFSIDGRQHHTNNLQSFFQLRGGVGAAKFDFPKGIDDESGAALEVRGLFGVEFFEVMHASAGLGVFLWGYPGETVGYGHFTTLELGIRF